MLFSSRDGSLKDASLLPARHRFEPPGERSGPSWRSIHRSAWKRHSPKFALARSRASNRRGPKKGSLIKIAENSVGQRVVETHLPALHKKSWSVTSDCAFMRRNARYVAYKDYQLFETPLALRQRALL